MQSGLARAIVFLVILITLGAAYVIPKLEFNYEFERFFPKDDPDLVTFNNYRKQFTSDNDFLLLAIENDAGIFQQDFLMQVDALTDSVKQAKFVLDVYGPTNASKLVVGPFGPISVSYLHPKQPERYAADSTLIYTTPSLEGTFFSRDRQSVALFIQHEPYLSKARSDTLVEHMDQLLAQFQFDNVRMSGRTVGQRYYINTMVNEVTLFVSLGILILIGILAFSFRTFWGVWVPLTIVLLSAVWLLALMQVTGKYIDIMSTLLPTILFVVGISDVIHILSRYLEELRKGKEKKDALRITIKEIGLATFLTSVTTAIGFLTLRTSGIVPMQEFGTYTAFGVFLAFILSFSFFPAILQLSKRPKVANKRLDRMYWYKQMHRLLLWNLKNRKAILIGSIGVIALALFGMSRIDIDSHLLEDLAEDDPERINFMYFEEQYTGVRPFEMAVRVADSNQSVMDYAFLQELDKVETYLHDTYGVGIAASPLSMVKMANRAVNGGLESEYRLPPTAAEYKKLKRLLRQVEKRPEFRYVVTEDERLGRISGRIVDLGSKAIKAKNQQLHADLAGQVNREVLDYELTGMALLIDKNNEELAANMMLGLLIAFGVIAVIMGLLFMSIKVILITLVPNILPLLIIAGYMGFTDIDLNAATAIIFTIAFGIAVDDTIHYMSKLRLELDKGKSMLYALKRTSISTGKAITVTSIILCSGFVTLILSTFTSTYYVGLLVSLTLLAAVLSDLILLPVLLLLFYGKRPKHKPKLRFFR